MMGTQPSGRQPALFSYHVDLERRVSSDHLLRRITAVLDLSFVLPTVGPCYGRSGHLSLDPRLIVKMMLLLFLYNIPSERELMEQIRVRLDFLWFLGLDLDTPIPDHSVLSKARTRWGKELFGKLFMQTVSQCVGAGLVDGRLLHIDSTMVKANAHKDSVVASGPELVRALREAYQEQEAKLQVLPDAEEPSPPLPQSTPQESSCAPEVPASPAEPEGSVAHSPQPPPAKSAGVKLPVNSTHISTTDPEAELMHSKQGVSDLHYKEHRLVDDAHGVITAVASTPAHLADGIQLAPLYEQHVATTGLKRGGVTVAGDRHYGTADNYIYCAQQGLRAHLREAKTNVEERGKLPLSQFTYEADLDRLRCPQNHYLTFHQQRPDEQLRVYLIEDPASCACCPLRPRCTGSKRGRSVRWHVQRELVTAAQAEANSAAGRYSRKRRKHVMEGSFADAMNNHGAKKARWRGLWRQQIQSWMIAVVQNLRILLRHLPGGSGRAVAAGAGGSGGGSLRRPFPWVMTDLTLAILRKKPLLAKGAAPTHFIS